MVANALQTMGDELKSALQNTIHGMCGTMCGQKNRGDKMRSRFGPGRTAEDSSPPSPLYHEDTLTILDFLRKSVNDDACTTSSKKLLPSNEPSPFGDLTARDSDTSDYRPSAALMNEVQRTRRSSSYGMAPLDGSPDERWPSGMHPPMASGRWSTTGSGCVCRGSSGDSEQSIVRERRRINKEDPWGLGGTPDGPDAKAAAACIAAHHRGRVVRQELARARAAASKIQCIERGRRAKKAFRKIFGKNTKEELCRVVSAGQQHPSHHVGLHSIYDRL